MNYYERHIGDYLKDTAHLSLLEHGVYTRLMDVYYTREGAIPEAEAARLIGARSKDEREALAVVLAEFFTLTDGAHAQVRCEREIERFRDKQNKAKRSADARWNAHRSQSEGNADASPNAMRTHSEGNAPRARPQSPDTSNQSLDAKHPSVNSPDGDPVSRSAKPLGVKDLEAEGVDAKVAHDWLAVRRVKKAPLTPTAWAAVKREAAIAGLTPAQAVKHAAEQNWQGFKASWLQQTGRNGQPAADADPFAVAH